MISRWSPGMPWVEVSKRHGKPRVWYNFSKRRWKAQYKNEHARSFATHPEACAHLSELHKISEARRLRKMHERTLVSV